VTRRPESGYQVNFPVPSNMRPYPRAVHLIIFLVTLLISSQMQAVAQPPKLAASAVKTAEIPPILGSRLVSTDALTKKAVNSLYDLEYDKAIADLERVVQLHPQDPFAHNYLLQAIVLKEMYRLNALDTTLYADDGFLTGKPLPADPKVKERIQVLSEESIRLAEQRLKLDPNDIDALYARGVTRGLRLSFAAIVEKSFFAALKNAVASRNDHERVLQLDPQYTNAKLIVGMHNFVLGSLPFGMRLLVGITGMSGSKKKGLELLHDVAASNVETNPDARVCLALFLRREARYQEALAIARGLALERPRNFIFALEEANLLKDAGLGSEAIDAYSQILAKGKAGFYADPHLERAAFGLAESLKGQRRSEEALKAYELALSFPRLEPEVKIRSWLGAGQMHDVLNQRDAALKDYQAVTQLDTASRHAAEARKLMRQPYRYPG
jgi:tetratricopeptide (TPR) repeat protein